MGYELYICKGMTVVDTQILTQDLQKHELGIIHVQVVYYKIPLIKKYKPLTTVIIPSCESDGMLVTTHIGYF